LSSSTWIDTLGRQIAKAPSPAQPNGSPVNPSTASLSACPVVNYPNQPVTFAYVWNLPTAKGGTLPLVLCYAAVYVRSHLFAGNNPSFWHEVNQSFNLLQSVSFPDGSYWAFAYAGADPSNIASYAPGVLQQIRMPTGGTITYGSGVAADGST